ncbi:hypothetical protein HMPREF0004_5087 [Achromobacter piechaudii ATCC 43553]|uniref:EamA domain-containing protein n=1 Tax=Achromobacter piechaudii ATCC 43553 TaxID=742159 RepID=D4XHZ0_9BURK|nr:hypothetical protein HMPREF0004_5087 [Achromobacter piechaudii ATCC 43553]
MPLTPGLLYLLASVTCSVTVAVLLKLARRYEVDVRQAIAMNYAVAALLCWFVLQPDPAALLAPTTPWTVLAALGVLLPSVFLAMAAAVRHAGIVRSDAGSGHLDVAAAGMAGIWGDRHPVQAGRARRHRLCGRAALGVRAGGGLMLAYLLARRVRWQGRHLLAGVALGVANFGNILTYIRAHQSLPEHPALVFASMNMGVITLGTLVGALVFREPLTRINALGIALALAAIVLMAPW